MVLDPLWSRALRETPLGPPVVIAGNPRSGTTFLQRFLVDTGVGCGREVWQMTYPSLTQQALLRPLLPWLEAVAPTRWHTSAAHETGLTFVEADDVASLFSSNDGFFLYAFFLAHHEHDLLDEFDPANRDPSEDFARLEQLWRRSQVAHESDRVVAKLFGVGACAPAFLAHFPAAHMLYMARDPRSTIPSCLSLVTSVLDAGFGFWSMPENHRRRYLDRLYRGLVLLLERFATDWTDGHIDPTRVTVVPFPRLMNDFDTLLFEVLERIGHPPGAALRARVVAQAETQRRFHSTHRYDLSRFGLTEAQVLADTRRFREAFLCGAEPPGSAAS
jgi:LPS sulfotransferase NodH